MYADSSWNLWQHVMSCACMSWQDHSKHAVPAQAESFVPMISQERVCSAIKALLAHDQYASVQMSWRRGSTLP